MREDVKMSRCEDDKIIRRCEDEQMFYRPLIRKTLRSDGLGKN